jgi:hypothetical protein
MFQDVSKIEIRVMKSLQRSLFGLMATCCCLLCHSPALSQNISTANLTWEAEEATDLQTSHSMAMDCVFKTNGTESVEWIQRKGELKTLYTVTSVEGSWSNVSAVGSFIYLLTRKGHSCKMTVERTETGIFVTMDFSKASEYTARHRFRIKSVK